MDCNIFNIIIFLQKRLRFTRLIAWFSHDNCIKWTKGKTVLKQWSRIWKIPLSKKIKSEITQLFQTICDPTGCSLLGSSIHGIFQARILEWVAISFFRGSSQPRDQTQVSCIVGRCFTIWDTSEVPKKIKSLKLNSLLVTPLGIKQL